MLELLLGQIPEAIYFALFMIFTKEIKSRRLIFVIGMILEYILILNVFPYSTLAHVLYFVLTYILMKILYNDKCNVTDVFTLGIASLVLMIICFALFIIMQVIFPVYIVYVILTKIVSLLLIIIFRNKLHNIQKIYNKLWNRSEHKYKIKSTTFRSLNLVLFNIMFYIINLGMMYTIIITK